jgi:hypothetical protein
MLSPVGRYASSAFRENMRLISTAAFAVHHDVGQRRQDEFAVSRHPEAGPSNVRERFETFTSAVDRLCDSARGARIFAFDVLANALEIICRRYRPADLFQDRRKRRRLCPTCSWVR